MKRVKSAAKVTSQLNWHAMHASEVLEKLKTSEEGLSQQEFAKRQAELGKNSLPESGATPLWQIVLRQFLSPLIYILVAAAIVSIVIGDVKDAIFIGIVLALNAGIGAYQEWQAEQSSQALRKLLRIRASVLRDGEVTEIEAEDVVPGDVVLLESGFRVPADMRLLDSRGLDVNESMLTGESLAVSKDANWIGEADSLLAEHHNMAYAGSMVTRGRARGVVVTIGTETAIGQLALDVLGNDGGKPPLIARMERFTNYVAAGTLIAAGVIGLLGFFLWNYTLVETVFFVIALAVAAIPEGLPVAMTVALAVATTRMARRNVIVRRLTAVEGLGSCTLIATDKTGTLTCNELTVREAWLPSGEKAQVSGEGFNPLGKVTMAGEEVVGGEPTGKALAAEGQELVALARAGVLCNEADLHQAEDSWSSRGDAVDVALLCFGGKLDLWREETLSRWPQQNQIAFESERQFAATFHSPSHSSDQGVVVFVKGAPERVLRMCAMAEEELALCEQAGLEMAKRGLRVLAIASGEVADPVSSNETPPEPSQLMFLGLIGMIDPLRPSAKEAVAACHAAGVQVAMVTGDHRITAFAIAKELGLAEHEHQVVTADALSNKSAEEIAQLVRDTRVFARVTPRQKLEIVQAAMAAGHFVAVTGDGANDAPALKIANIGVAMGKSGTDVAREASELVISDDNFSSIVGGIEEGRIAYDNIRKVIYLLLSMGAAELLMVLLAVLNGLPVPLLPVQLLWLNLVTNGIQGVAMAFEPGEETLKRKPRAPHEPIFNRLMIERMLVAVTVVGLGGFTIFDWAIRTGMPLEQARNFLLLVMVLFELFHVGNCRSENHSAFYYSPLRSPILFFGTLGAFLVHLLGMYSETLREVLTTSPVDWKGWGIAVAVSILIVPAVELHKWWWNRTPSSDSTRQPADNKA